MISSNEPLPGAVVNKVDVPGETGRWSIWEAPYVKGVIIEAGSDKVA